MRMSGLVYALAAAAFVFSGDRAFAQETLKVAVPPLDTVTSYGWEIMTGGPLRFVVSEGSRTVMFTTAESGPVLELRAITL